MRKGKGEGEIPAIKGKAKPHDNKGRAKGPPEHKGEAKGKALDAPKGKLDDGWRQDRRGHWFQLGAPANVWNPPAQRGRGQGETQDEMVGPDQWCRQQQEERELVKGKGKTNEPEEETN
jgi:hypothetical protein